MLKEVVIQNDLLLSFERSTSIKARSLTEQQLTYTIEDSGLDSWIFGKNGSPTENKLLVFIKQLQWRGRQRISQTVFDLYNIVTGVRERHIEFDHLSMNILTIDNNHNFVVVWAEEKLRFISTTNLTQAKEVSYDEMGFEDNGGDRSIVLATFNARNDHMIILWNRGHVSCLRL